MTRAIPASSSASGTCHPSSNGTALGATIGVQPSFSGSSGPRLASRVRELGPEHRAVLAYEFADAREHLDVFILPDAEISRADPAFRRHRARFGDHHPRTAGRELSK